MIVEVIGIHPTNKGALLMLSAIRERLSAEFPKARFAVPINWPTDMRLAEGLRSSLPIDMGPINLSAAGSLLPAKVRRAVGFSAASDIDVVLDASGFGYGDYWGLDKLQRRLGRLASGWKKGKRTLIVMPQALGPFDKPGMADAARTAFSKADLVFVRDRTSMEHVRKLGSLGSHVKPAPDFTNLLHPELPARLDGLRGASLIIPNEKVAGGDQAKRAAYVEYLVLAAEMLKAAGKRVVFLVHEGAGDRRFVDEVNARLAQPAEVVDEKSPLTTKAVIGVADLIVSSRFHGLVSALSSAVPALACGWSHKYAELMNDYGCPDFNLDLSDKASWRPKLEALIAASGDPTFRAALGAAADKQRALSEAMWSDVVALLRSRFA